MAFAGTARFELLGKLGEGGMGVVYEAYDRERNMRVALKTLRYLDPASLYRFKREFRALNHLSHPNIIALYELVSEDENWFLTMEVIRGSDLLTYVHHHGVDPSARYTAPSSSQQASDHTLDTRVIDPVSGGYAPIQDEDGGEGGDCEPAELPVLADAIDLGRLRDAMGQLAQALDALHAAGLVHRDLKPSNVRVTERGRVVLMDFGIVAEAADADDTGTRGAVGTPAYMAPEQAAGDPPTAAADWYAFGVILYALLTGRLPYQGPSEQVLIAKQQRDPMAPSELAFGVPSDLEALCLALLRRNPRERPTGAAILDRLGVTRQQAAPAGDTTHSHGRVFVGRTHELAALAEAWARVSAGETRCVFVRGASGMGKTSLLRYFVHTLDAEPTGERESPTGPPVALGASNDPSFGRHIGPLARREEGAGWVPATDKQRRQRAEGTAKWGRNLRRGPLVLSGRCHERESLSYKAFDDVMEKLADHLTARAAAGVDDPLPGDIALLARPFPVLLRVPGIAQAPVVHTGDEAVLRTRAGAALRALLAALARTRPLILRVDDLQWADRDSLELLAELFEPPAPPRVLLLASVRSENLREDDGGLDLAAALNRIGAPAERVTLTLGPLSPGEQKQLVARLLGPDTPLPAVSDDYWDESAGSPMLLTELARFAAESPQELTPEHRVGLEDVIARRVDRLPDTERALLEVIAIAGEPTPLSLLAEAIELTDEVRERAAATLRVTHLARHTVPGHEPWFNAYHDKIRETVVARMPAARRRLLHMALARAMEGWDGAAVPALARHWLAAGDAAQAADYMMSAARTARDKLAFDRAAELYKAALDNRPTATDSERLEVLRPLADTLVLAGRCYEAARVYERAAAIADGAQAREFERRCADNLLRSGHVQEGLAQLAQVTAQLGTPLPRTRVGAIASIVWQRAVLALRGLDYEPRPASAFSAQTLGELDTLYAAATALGMIDQLRGTAVQMHHLRAALRLGEETRACRALAIEVAYASAAGGKHIRRAEELSREVMLRARKLGDPYAVGVAQMSVGMTMFFSARMRRAARAFKACLAKLDDVAGAPWEKVTARYFRVLALINIGELGRVARSVKRLIDTSERRRDLYALNVFKSEPNTWRLLLADDPAEAHRSLDTALIGWPDRPYYLAHYQVALARAIIYLYEGDGQAAARILDEHWADFERVMITRVAFTLGELLMYRARAALLIGDHATALAKARRLARLRLPTARALAQTLEAPVRLAQGDTARAERLLSDALDAFREHDAQHMVAACRHRLGALLGGDQGEAFIAETDAWMASQGAVSPERLLGLLTPGYN